MLDKLSTMIDLLSIIREKFIIE